MAVASYEVDLPGGFLDEGVSGTARKKQSSVLDRFHVCPIGGVRHYLEPTLARISAEVTAAAQRAGALLVRDKESNRTR